MYLLDYGIGGKGTLDDVERSIMDQHSYETYEILKGLEMQLFVEIIDNKELIKKMKEIISIILSGIKRKTDTQFKPN